MSHEHYFNPKGLKVCPICEQRFDLPIAPKYVNIYKGKGISKHASNKISRRKDE